MREQACKLLRVEQSGGITKHELSHVRTQLAGILFKNRTEQTLLLTVLR